MREETSLLIAVFFLIILGGGFFGLGYFLGNKGKGEIKPPVCPPSLLDSKILQNWTVFAMGEVKEISGRDLTLISNGETLKISIPEETIVQSINLETNEIAKASFGDIKIGQKVEIQATIKPEEKMLIGHLITILP